MRARRVLVATGIAAVSVVSFASMSSAHDKVLAASCEAGLTVNLTQYNAGVVNTVKVTEDAATLADTTFGATYQHAFPNLAKTVAHSYHVTVTAGDGAQYGLDQTLSIPACQTPATTTTEATPSTTTTIPATTSPSSSAAPSTATPTTAPPAATTVPSTTPSTVTSSPTTTSPPSTTTVPSSSAPSSSSVTPETSPPTSEGTLIHVERDTNPPSLGPAPGKTPDTLPATGVPSLWLFALAAFCVGLGLILLGICTSSARSDRTG